MFKSLKNKLFYGWVVVITFFLVNAVIMGTTMSFGVFFKSLENEFNIARATTSAVFSLRMALSAFVSIVGGWALDRYGPRVILVIMAIFTTLSFILTSQATATWQLFFTFSLLLSLGTGAAFVVVMSTISKWFDKKRGLAVGISGAGGGFGQVIMAPLAAYLILTYDWRFAYIVLGIIAGLIILPAAKFIKKDPAEIGAVADGITSGIKDIPEGGSTIAADDFLPVGLAVGEALKTRSFWLLVFNMIFTGFSSFFILTHIVPHATDLGFSAVQAATILSLIGFAQMAGRPLGGVIADKIGRKKAGIIFSLFQAGSVFLLPWTKDLWLFYVFALFYGLAQGGMGTAVISLIADVFGLRHLGKLIGITNIGWTIGAAIGPVVGGLVFDASGSYFSIFLIVIAVVATGPIILTFLRRETDGTQLR